MWCKIPALDAKLFKQDNNSWINGKTKIKITASIQACRWISWFENNEHKYGNWAAWTEHKVKRNASWATVEEKTFEKLKF